MQRARLDYTFAPVPEALIMQLAAEPALIAMWSLINRYGRGSDRVTASWQQLADGFGLDRQRVSRWTRKLAAAGWAEIETAPGAANTITLRSIPTTVSALAAAARTGPDQPRYDPATHPDHQRCGPSVPDGQRAQDLRARERACSTPRAESSCTACAAAPRPVRDTPAALRPSLSVDARLAGLRTALRSAGLAPRWDRLGRAAQVELLELVRLLGTEQMARIAAATTAAAVRDGKGPALYVQGYLRIWRAQAQVWPHESGPEHGQPRCPDHPGRTLPCPRCAASEPDVPAAEPGAARQLARELARQGRTRSKHAATAGAGVSP